MKVLKQSILFCLFIISFALPNSAFSYDKPFMWGISINDPKYLNNCGTSDDKFDKIKIAIDEVAKLGGKWFRMHIIWRDIEEQIIGPNLEGWQNIAVNSWSDISQELVGEYIDATKIEWEKYHDIIDYASEQGVNVILILGAGFSQHYEYIPESPGFPIAFVDWNPELYKASLSLHVRAAVREFKDKVKIWQLENELNTAGYQTISGLPWWWRHGCKWWSPGEVNLGQLPVVCDSLEDLSFTTNLLYAMKSSVKEEDPEAKVFMNFHVLNTSLISAWSEHLDYIGLDIYWDKIWDIPAIFKEKVFSFLGMENSAGMPDIGTAIQSAKALAGQDSEGKYKPVIIAEVGYNNSVESEEEQADWIAKSAEAAVEYGAIGYFYWTISTNDPGTEIMGLLKGTEECTPKHGYSRYKEVIKWYHEPPRVFRRPVYLSPTTMAGTSCC